MLSTKFASKKMFSGDDDGFTGTHSGGPGKLKREGGLDSGGGGGGKYKREGGLDGGGGGGGAKLQFG